MHFKVIQKTLIVDSTCGFLALIFIDSFLIRVTFLDQNSLPKKGWKSRLMNRCDLSWQKIPMNRLLVVKFTLFLKTSSLTRADSETKCLFKSCKRQIKSETRADYMCNFEQAPLMECGLPFELPLSSLLIPPVWDDQPVRSPLPPRLREIQTSSAHFRKQLGNGMRRPERYNK